jgi:RimJ/RimL family protein N-acetyltransferase
MIQLKQVTIYDCCQIRTWYSNPEMTEYFRRWAPEMDWSSDDRLLSMLTWDYIIYENDKAVGLCCVRNFDTNGRSAEVGMAIDTNSVASRTKTSLNAYKQLCDYLFYYQKLDKLYMKILAHREQLQKRLEDGGWKTEGKFRQSCDFQGKKHDETVMGLLKEEYQKWQSRF